MPGKKGFDKVYKVGNHLVVSIRPIGSKFKAVACLFAAPTLALAAFLDMAVSGGVGVVFGMRPVGNHENLHILIQPRRRPKAVPLITFDLVKGFAYRNAAPFQFHMHKRQAVYKDCNIIAGVVYALTFLVLIDDLQAVVMDILFINQIDIFGQAIVPMQKLHMVGLYFAGLFHNTLVFAGNASWQCNRRRIVPTHYPRIHSR